MGAVGNYRLFWRDQRPRESAELKPLRPRFTSFWIRRLRCDRAAGTTLRLLLAREGSMLLRCTEDKLLDVLQQRISTGQILAYEWVPERGGGAEQQGESSAYVPLAPAFPLEERPLRAFVPPSSGVQPDPALLPEDADAAAIAEGLRQAAETGVPFCEECARAAASRAA